MVERRLVLSTRNRHKVGEIVALAAGTPFRFEGLESHPHVPDVVEDGTTFTENALKKARAAAEATGLLALADDSGLEVDALDGAPGVRSARYAGEDADDDANCDRLLSELAGHPTWERGGRFRCAIALCHPDGREWTLEGVCEGRIGTGRRGTSGFGYDPLFFPEGHDRTFAEMSGEEKGQLSHRGKALCLTLRLLAELERRGELADGGASA